MGHSAGRDEVDDPDLFAAAEQAGEHLGADLAGGGGDDDHRSSLSADGDVSTRAICDAAGVTAPTLYHHFGDKDGLLAAVVDFGWAAFLETKRVVAAVVHDHVADDVRAGWDNHLEFARENPSFYKLMWSPAVAANSGAVREAYQMLYDRLELGAGRGQLRMSVETASRIVLSATTGAALSLISQLTCTATARSPLNCARP